MEDEILLVAKAKENPEAFGRIYDVFYGPIFGFMYSRTSNAEVAKDLTSETFFQGLKHLHRFKPRKGISIKSWLFAIAVAQVGNYFRSRSRVFEIVTDQAPDLIAEDDVRPDIAFAIREDAKELEDQITLLKNTMKQLNEKQQSIVALRFFSHMTIPEISRIMRMKEGTVKSHIHRALKKLQSLMMEERNYEPAQTAHYRTVADTARIKESL